MSEIEERKRLIDLAAQSEALFKRYEESVDTGEDWESTADNKALEAIYAASQ